MPVLYSKKYYQLPTKKTVDLILYAIRSYYKQPPIPELALKASASGDPLRYIFDFVAENVVYKKDPFNNEIVTTPHRLMLDGQGDCKKMTVFIGAALLYLQVPFYCKMVSYDGLTWSHIYIIVPAKYGYVTLDPVNNNRYNSEVKHAKSIVFDINNNIMQKLSLLGRDPGGSFSVNSLVSGLNDVVAVIEDDVSFVAASPPVLANEDQDLNDWEALGDDDLYSVDLSREFDESEGVKGIGGISGLFSTAKGRARRKEKRAARKSGRIEKKSARKTRRNARKNMTHSEKKADRKKERDERRQRRKDGRRAKSMGKAQSMPGPISRFIGKYPEMWLMYFGGSLHSDIELTGSGLRKLDRVKRAAARVQKKKGVSPSQLLAFVDSQIMLKYGMPAEEFLPVFAAHNKKGVAGLGEPVSATVIGVVAGITALVGAVTTLVVGLSKGDLNESDLPKAGDIAIPGIDPDKIKGDIMQTGAGDVWKWATEVYGDVGDIIQNAKRVYDTVYKGGDVEPDVLDKGSDSVENRDSGSAVDNKPVDETAGGGKINILWWGLGALALVYGASKIISSRSRR